MKLSKRLKSELKKKIAIILMVISIFTCTLAIFKLTDISMLFSKNSSSEINLLQDDNNEKVEGARLENTDTITYIYDAQDFVAFRDAVNAGDTYSGKTVYLMDDIDLSTVCSEELGVSWEPIGTYTDTEGNAGHFIGTFDGNYHKISNLYISSSDYNYQGLFKSNKGIIQNIILENAYVYNSYSVVNGASGSGGIVGLNYGTVQNCGVNSGSITNVQSVVHTESENGYAAGIVGYAQQTSKVLNCYNMATITSTVKTNNTYQQAAAGGIVGHNKGGVVENCYNTGKITATGYNAFVGGIIGRAEIISSGYIKNSYNIGTISATGSSKKIGGIIGRNGYSSSYKGITVTNCYCTTATTYLYAGYTSSTSNRIAAETLKTYTVKLGSSYAYDVYNKNSGYPLLAWENNTTVMRLNKNQEYIKVGDSLQLNVVESDEVTQKIGTNYANSNFKWTSTNEDVASVDEEGIVTGLSDGYTTVYAYHESGLYAMTIINVAKDFTNPQIETGNGFTTILKSNGTVWTIGNNASGQLGNGKTENTKVPVQVHIDEDTTLNNIVKIAVGTDHVVALRNDGKVYAWGSNTYGQLGQNNTTSSNYAKAVLGTDGASYLSNIVDISAGAYGTVALDKNGNVYVWGNGSNGEIGNNKTVSSNLPVKTTIKNAIQVSIGQGQVSALTSEGVIWSWGRNNCGQLGINCTNNTSYPMKTATNVTEISVGAYHSMVKKIDRTVYATGSYTGGRLGTGSTANATTYVKVNLPNTVTETNKVKYVKAGRLNTTLVLADGSVWETGVNNNGELGNGTTTDSASFVQGSIKNGIIQNILTVGRNNGTATDDTGQALNTAVITKDGNIYTTGDNTYGQIGDNTTTNTSYYTRMGFAYLDYEDKTVEVREEGYQIDANKLKYIYSSINAYNNEQTYSLRRNKIYIIKYNNCKSK